MDFSYDPKRRLFLRQMAVGAAAFWVTPGVFAEQLARTPRQTEGPFYPNKMPLDTDNDLLIIGDGITPAVGVVTHLSGTVTNVKGVPLRNALVEIWQVDAKAAYIHTKDPNHRKRDTNFQGYGRFSTDRKGRFYFRTIRPVAYPGRTPHIHVKVSHKRRHLLTTQLYIKGHPSNKRDGIFRGTKNSQALAVPFQPIKGSKIGALKAHFPIIVGYTPPDAD